MLQNIGIERAWTCAHSQKGNETNARNKILFHIKGTECSSVTILFWLQNLNSDIQLPNFSWFDLSTTGGIGINKGEEEGSY